MTDAAGGLFGVAGPRPARRTVGRARAITDRPATVAELRKRTDRAIGARLNAGKPLTAAWLGDAARNAVTPPAAEIIVSALVEAITGHALPDPAPAVADLLDLLAVTS